MKTKIILIIACCISFASSYQEERNNRMFSLFNVVKFKNTACQAQSSTALSGICHTAEECSDNGGSADGNCAASFGVCCVIRVSTCGSTVSQNCSFIENVGFPTAVTATGACAYTVTRCSSDICQIRLDFVSPGGLVLAQPAAATGLCADMLTIAPGAGTGTQPSAADPPVICGTNTGQHMYIDAGTANTAATLTFNIIVAGTQTWRIKVSQIECFSPTKAPAGCLQYFFGGTRNTVTSFNFDGTACTTGCFIQNQDYNVCFRTELGMCGIQIAESTLTMGDAFLLTNAAATAKISAANCPNAFLQIKDIVPDFPAAQDTFCGSNLAIVAAAFPAALTSVGRPFKFRVVARGTAAAAIAQNTLPGFSVDAVQVPCPVVLA